MAAQRKGLNIPARRSARMRVPGITHAALRRWSVCGATAVAEWQAGADQACERSHRHQEARAVG